MTMRSSDGHRPPVAGAAHGHFLAKLPHLNRSQRSDYRQYYDRRTQNLVKHLYREDIDQFSYGF